VTYFKTYFLLLPEATKENHVRITGVPAEIQTAIYVDVLLTRRTQIPDHCQNCRGWNPAVDTGCVYALHPAGVECVTSTHRVSFISVRSPVLISDILIEVFSVVPVTRFECRMPRPFYVLSHYLLTELSPSSEAANYAATQELPSTLWDTMVHCRAHKSPPLFPILRPDRSSPYHPILSKIYFNTVHPPTSWPS
jgi:hypothetical protein